MFDFSEKIIPVAFWVTRPRSNYWSSSQHCPLTILWTIRLIITKHGTVVAARKWILHCIYASLLTFAPEEPVSFQTFLVLILVCPFNMVKAYIKYFKILFIFCASRFTQFTCIFCICFLIREMNYTSIYFLHRHLYYTGNCARSRLNRTNGTGKTNSVYFTGKYSFR